MTGTTSGLGSETTRQLAAHGGRVVLAARSTANGREAVARIMAVTWNRSPSLRPKPSQRGLVNDHPGVGVAARAAGQVTSGLYRGPGQHKWPSSGTPHAWQLMKLNLVSESLVSEKHWGSGLAVGCGPAAAARRLGQ